MSAVEWKQSGRRGTEIVGNIRVVTKKREMTLPGVFPPSVGMELAAVIGAIYRDTTLGIKPLPSVSASERDLGGPYPL